MDKEENPLEVFNELERRNGIERFVSEGRIAKRCSRHASFARRKIQLRSNERRHSLSAIELELGTSNRRRSGPKVAAMIWHEPLMCVSPTRYSGALLEQCGFIVPDFEPNGNGYPIVTTNHLIEHSIEGMLLSSEPHNFAIEEGEAISEKVVLKKEAPNLECVHRWRSTHMVRNTHIIWTETVQGSLRGFENEGILACTPCAGNFSPCLSSAACFSQDVLVQENPLLDEDITVQRSMWEDYTLD